jgi:hypothetical protein
LCGPLSHSPVGSREDIGQLISFCTYPHRSYPFSLYLSTVVVVVALGIEENPPNPQVGGVTTLWKKCGRSVAVSTGAHEREKRHVDKVNFSSAAVRVL